VRNSRSPQPRAAQRMPLAACPGGVPPAPWHHAPRDVGGAKVGQDLTTGCSSIGRKRAQPVVPTPGDPRDCSSMPMSIDGGLPQSGRERGGWEMTQWSFEADYFTACNCDWGCPCNFNARPTEGRCMGWGAWSILTGQFDATALDGTRFALYYMFPGPVEQGQGTACAYVDSRATPAQQQALEAIGTGKAGGGIFDLFGAQLVTTWLPTKVVPITF